MRWFLPLLLLLAPPALAQPARAPTPGILSLFHVPPAARPTPPQAQPAQSSPGILCRAAIAAAERAHGIPTGLLLAIGLVESGRTDPQTGERHPWPWAVNAEGRGALHETRDAALAFVRQAEAAGTRSIDIGCMQVNRLHHAGAFASLEHGFDPMANADYAARFLKQLKDGPAAGDWMKAAGFYHSQTPERADPYRAKVQTALGTVPRTPQAAPGGGGQMLSNGPAAIIASTTPGRSLDAYRARPVPLAMVTAGLRTPTVR